MIKSFRNKRTALLFVGRVPKGMSHELAQSARRKLVALNEAEELVDLRVPPGNRLEALIGDRTGEHSIRVNSQFRLCFVWRGQDAYDVEIVDYH